MANQANRPGRSAPSGGTGSSKRPPRTSDPSPTSTPSTSAPRPASDADRAAKIRAAGRPAARAERMRRVTIVASAIVVALVIVAVVAVLKLSHPAGTASPSSSGSPAADTAVVKALTSVPDDVFNGVGAGTSQNPPKKVDAAPLTKDGKPRVLYDGAEYCPFCAAQRWAVVVAMTRFGTWSNLGTTTSSANDYAPNTASLSFHGATFTSTYLSFTGVEETTNTIDPSTKNYQVLDRLSSADAALVKTYNAPPYTSAQNKGAIPFIDIGGTWLSSGASFDPKVLGGLTQIQIADKLSNANDPITKQIIGEANHLTAAICDVTKGQPANVCVSPGVLQASEQMGANTSTPSGSSSSSTSGS